MLLKKKQIIEEIKNNRACEAKIVRNISIVGILGNILLSLFKFTAGVLGNSSAMVSDSIHSLSDVFATFIAYLGVRVSKIEPDEDHPYGHDRLECVASLILGLILALTAFIIGYTGIKNIFFNSIEITLVPKKIALIAAVVSIIVKEFMYHYTMRMAKVIDSAAFQADAWHHRSDAFSSIGSLIGIFFARVGYPVMDFVASVVISLFVLKIAYDILKDAIVKMLDTSCDKTYIKTLRKFISNQEGVICVDVLHTRMFGNKVYIDLEIQVDGNISLRQAHDIAENVHMNVERTFSNIKHVMIHVNPYNG